MEDFITTAFEREICKKCRFEYPESEFCRNCRIDVHAVEKSRNWFEDEDFKKFGVYEGINLGELMDYNLRRILFKAMAEIEKETRAE